MEIKFGTDGWRGIIADDFTFANLRRVSVAVARYIQENGIADRGVIIGYDTRFLAEEFAGAVADVLTHYNIKVYMTDRATPTPVVAFSVLDRKAAGAVMLTASHNPPTHNGFKFIPDYAGPAFPQITDRITELIPETTEPLSGREELVEEFDPRPGYYQFLAQRVDLDKIKASGLRIVVNPMHGAGIGYLEEILEGLGIEVVSQRNWRDPLFGGKMPEPKPELLEDLREAVLAGHGDMGLALDGDGDRFGIVDSRGAYIFPNEVLALLARYLLAERKQQGRIARTVSTTTLLDRIAQKYGQEIVETPVGFKFQAQAMLTQAAILAGEESGGLSIAGHVPEKDGVLACLLMAELTAHYGKPLSEVLADIYREFGRLYTRRLDFRCSSEVKQDILAKLENFKPQEIGGFKVADIITIDGYKYVLDNGSWVLVRASGTESLFRVYGEAKSQEELANIQCALAKELGLQ